MLPLGATCVPFVPFGDVHFWHELLTIEQGYGILKARGDSMSRISRSYSQSGVYHVLFRGINQQRIFEETADYIKLKQIILKIKEDMGFKVYAYCFMSNHVHIVIKEKEERDISLIMKRVLTRYARWYNTKYGRSGALIANRYKSVPVEFDEYFIHLIRYVHQNPLKSGITKNILEYPHSSYIEYAGESELADVEFVYGMMNKDEFEDFHEYIEEKEFRVSDSKRDTDEEVNLKIKKKYKIENPKEIALLDKEKRNEILQELKLDYPVRQLQRVTGISRGIISRV